MSGLGHVALGSWSGGRFLRYGVPLDEQRLIRLLTPGDGIHTLVTADVYGQGAGDRLLGEAIAGHRRESFAVVGAVGHDFYSGRRDGARGYPRFTDPGLRAPAQYHDYLRRATEQSLERCGLGWFDALLLHNPDRDGYSSQAVWQAMSRLRDEGLARSIGIAPGPANGFTLDMIDALERFGSLIDWAMLILGPLEPWPARLVLPACARHGVGVIARVVDYGGLFHDDLASEDALAPDDHRAFRPAGWVASGRARIDALRPVAERHDLTLLQLACAWTLAQEAVVSVVPTLIQEAGAQAKPIEQQRAELAALPPSTVLTPDDVALIDSVGDNTGCMSLKGASPRHQGPATADRWPLDAALLACAKRWGIDPERDLVPAA